MDNIASSHCDSHSADRGVGAGDAESRFAEFQGAIGRRILSIDGGGIKGTIPAAFLAELEKDLPEPIGSYFDLIAGTSTGGILAIGLALGFRASQLLDFYVERGPEIFGQQQGGLGGTLAGLGRSLRHFGAPKHDADRLRGVLADVLHDRRIGDAKHRLLIPAWEADRQSVYIYKTAHHHRLKSDYKKLALDAAMGTAAAPTYMRRYRTADGVGLVDGGVWANNPTALAVVEAISLLDWPGETQQVLSLGCSHEAYDLPEAPGLGGMGLKLVKLFMDGQSHGSMGIAKLLTGHGHRREALHRICPNVPAGVYSLDDTRKIERLRGIGASCAREARPKLEQIFFARPAEPFLPVYSLGGDGDEAHS